MRLLMIALLGIFISSSNATENGAPSRERIESVRKTFKAVPPGILKVKEPIKVLWSDILFDGGTIFVKAEDAQGKIFHATLTPDKALHKVDTEDKLAWSKNYQTSRIQIGFDENVNRGSLFPIRSPEEAALYGLLLRWSENPHYAEVDIKLQGHQKQWTELFLTSMDYRFATPPVGAD